MEKFFFHPTWQGGDSPASVAACEAVLGEHFGHECVVTGSGRAAIDLVLRQSGLNRYRSRVALTPLISRCVLDVVVNHAYPIDPAENGVHDLVVRYHQMGIPQTGVGFNVPVIEDICHAFFADPDVCIPDAGKGWALFSLPKFFPMAGMGGGIVTRDADEAHALRSLRDHSEPLTDAEQRSQQEDFHLAYSGDPRYNLTLEMLYLKRRLNHRCHIRDISGFPSTIKALEMVRLRRRAVMERLLEALGEDMFPPSWQGKIAAWLPFALPIFLDSEERMNAAVKSLCAHGIQSGVYSIDVARDQAQPKLQRAVVVPCHQQLNDATINLTVSALKE